MHDSVARLGVAHAALQDAAGELNGTSAAGPLGLALIQLRLAMNAVNAEMAEEAAAERRLAQCDPYQVAAAMSAAGVPETVDGRSIWSMDSAELARLAGVRLAYETGGAASLLAVVSGGKP